MEYLRTQILRDLRDFDLKGLVSKCERGSVECHVGNSFGNPKQNPYFVGQ